MKRMAMLILMSVVLFHGCSRKPDDSSVTSEIKARLYSDSTVKQEPIEVTVTKGEATLAGEVSAENARQRILDITLAVPGVLKINDLMAVKAASLEAVAAQPIAITIPPVPAPAPPKAAPKQAALASSSPSPQVPAAAAVAPPPLPAAPTRQVAPLPPPPPQPRKVVIPEGTTVRVITTDAIDADPDKINSTFLAALYEPITVGSEVILPERTNVYLRLLDAKKSGKFKGKSEIHVTLDSVEFQGDRYVLRTSTHDVEGKSQGKETAKKVGIGAALGTAVGAIAGGGKGAAIGAAAGGGGGAATQAIKKGEHLQIPSETKLDFKLEQPLELTIPPGR